MIPPSGPTTRAGHPSFRQAQLAEAHGGARLEDDRARRLRDRLADLGGPTTVSVTSGIHARRDCLAASRAVARHFASERAPRSALPHGTQRAAAQGMIRSTPTSVISSTASSPRSPLGMAWTTVIAGSGPGHRPPGLHGQLEPRAGMAAATTHSATRPAPSADVGSLARPQPAHGGRVPAFRSGQQDEVLLEFGPAGQEDGRLRHQRSLRQRPLNASRSR